MDVDTVEALAEALRDYKGTVIFTSHDRHFMKRRRDVHHRSPRWQGGHYRGDYESYLYSVNKEIEDGEREKSRRHGQSAERRHEREKVAAKAPRRDERTLRKE